MKLKDGFLLAVHSKFAVPFKAEACEMERGPIDLNPMLVIGYSDGTHYAGMPIGTAFVEEFDLGEALAHDLTVEWANHGHGSLDMVVVICDGYVAFAVDDIPNKGDLKRDFQSNAASTVREGMVTTLGYWDDGEVHVQTVTQPYRFTDGGVLEWDEPTVADELVVDTDDPEIADQHGRGPGAVIFAIYNCRDQGDE